MPDPTKLMELRDKERREFTLIPGITRVDPTVNSRLLAKMPTAGNRTHQFTLSGLRISHHGRRRG